MPERLENTINEKKSGGIGKTLSFVLLALLLIFGFIYMKRNTLNFKFDNPAIPNDGSISDKDLPAYIEFARKVDVSICNFGFNNLQSYIQVNSPYFTQDLLNDFQTNFFTDDLQKKIISQKIICTAENITAQQTKVSGQKVGVWFTGTLVYASMGTNPPSTIQIPYSHTIVVQKFSDGLKVVSFENINAQKNQTF